MDEIIKPVLKPLLIIHAVYAAMIFIVLSGMAYYFGAAIHIFWFAELGVIALSVFVFIFSSAKDAYIYATQRYQITPTYVLIQRGLVTQDVERIPVVAVSDFEVVRPLVLRMFNLGILRIVANDGKVYEFYNIENPVEVSKKIQINIGTIPASGVQQQPGSTP